MPTINEHIQRRAMERLRKGGGRASLQPGHVILEKTGGGKARVTYLDRTNDVRPLVSNRLNLEPGLRAVGNLYGDSVLMASLGPQKPFAQEAVDGGGKAGDGLITRMLDASYIAKLAQNRMDKIDLLTHRCNTKAECGSHSPIVARNLVDAICVYGMSITEIAIRSGWWVQGKHHVVVHDKQRVKIRTMLVNSLETIDHHWLQNLIDARRIVGVIETTKN